MVFNNDVLFLHLGKTGGMSITNYLCQILVPPIISVVDEASFKNGKCEGIELLMLGNRHTNLIEAKEFLEDYGILLSDFKLIFCVIREPVDMEYSFYRHLRKEEVKKRLPDNAYNRKKLAAAQQSFDEFAKMDYTHFKGELKDFFTLDNKIPANMKIVRFEEIPQIVQELLKPFEKISCPFPHKNKSTEQIEFSQLSQEALLNIRRKYAWVYENKFY